MQERSEAQRRAIWPRLNIATSTWLLVLGEGSEATERYNRYANRQNIAK